MIVNSSSVGMGATTTKRTSYTETNESLMSNLQSGEKRYTQSTFKNEYETKQKSYLYAENVRDTEGADRLGKKGRAEQNKGAGKGIGDAAFRNGDDYPYGISYMPSYTPVSLNRIREKQSAQDFMKQLRLFLFNFRNSIFDILGGRRHSSILNLASSDSFSLWTRTNYTSYTYTEEESMTFETTGKVVTADGRTIDFNMQIEMSREFYESAESLSRETMAIMTDPLVISLDSNPVSVSDQKWSFDIDGDGTKDSISLLSKGAGFLAYDRDGNGKIDDGSELFGTKSGNGFADLAAFDADGNGWIDEADPIYEKLSVWIKDDAGNDKLISLKEANVGAIYLGSVATDYSLKSEDNTHNAQVRRSGMYLTEDGMAKTVQQLDMVKDLVS